MLSYRLINSGKTLRREYLSLNRSPLFQALPERDFAHEQKRSYNDFLYQKLPQLLTSSIYSTAELSDYNNHLQVSIEKAKCNEPEITEEEAREKSLTWEHSISFLWNISWDLQKIQIKFLNKDLIQEGWEKFFEEHKINNAQEQKKCRRLAPLEANLYQWVKESFKIGKFTLKKKSSPRQWEIKESKGELKLLLEVLEQSEDNLVLKFNCKSSERVTFCHLPKMTTSGGFIINGHDKVAVFQSVRAPTVHFFTTEKRGFYAEIIPFKGPWINIFQSSNNPRQIELKFLNSKLTVDLLAVFKTFACSSEVLEKLFGETDLDLTGYSQIKPLEIGTGGLPRFLFAEQNSYFNIGKLGRKNQNRKSVLFYQVADQTLAENLYDKQGKLILKKNARLTGKNLQILQNSLQKKKIESIAVPHSTSELYSLKIKSPHQPEKPITVIGFGEEVSEDKSYFDLADLVCVVSNYLNMYHGLVKIEKEEEKDILENQIVRHIGNLAYNIFVNHLGGFWQEIKNEYLTSYISQLKKVDFAKIPNLKNFAKLINDFFNDSPLIQLQNQNNPLAEISYIRKLSVLGLGGFGVANTTLNARNVNSSYYGRYDLVETPEGQKVGLIHNLTLGAEIDDYEQIVTSYYPVQNGVVLSSKVPLDSVQEKDKYIAHANIEIDEKNQILTKTVLARHQGSFVWVPREKINYIDSSFYQLNSITSATIPFFHHNDATRMLMASNMQRQAATLLKSQAPLVASGIEKSLFDNSPLAVRVQEKGEVEYVDSQKITVKEKNSKEKKIYNLKQSVVSNKNLLNFSLPLVQQGERVEKGQIIANGNCIEKGELALGYNLRVAYMCWKGYNYEDAIVVSDRLIKEDILTSFFVKKHTIVRESTKYGPEIFTASLPHLEKKYLSHLDEQGIIKVGTQVEGETILAGKLSPVPVSYQETEEELILMKILGKSPQKFVNSSLYLPMEERGVVYQVKKRQFPKNQKEIELVEVYVAHERKIEAGDKLTTRFGNKGVVAKIIPESQMPFDEEGKIIDIIFNPLGVPTRMNSGQLLEVILASAVHKLDTKLLVRPFNTFPLEAIKSITQEAGIKNFGNQKLFDGQTGLHFQQEVYNGYIYVLKLNHMAADKFHARNTGPYSLIYQQPLKGRSHQGGQRVGEMESWVLEAHGAAYNLMEMTSAKSDDISKRLLMKDSLHFDNRQIDLRSSNSESFNLLIQYLWGIGFDLQAFNHQGGEINFYDSFRRK